MADLDRVLDSLLHDLRSPLGVATGYLRLVRDGRVAEPHETERVLGKAQDALQAMSELCANAAAWVAPPPPRRLHHVPAAMLVAAVTSRLARDSVTVAMASRDGRVLTLGDDTNLVAAAIATVITRLGQAHEPPPTVSVRWSQEALVFDLVDPAGHVPRRPFDPWRFSGLAVPLAWRTIRHAGGDVIAPGDEPAAASIAFRAAPPPAITVP